MPERPEGTSDRPWPPGAESVHVDLGGGVVHYLDFAGPPGARTLLAVHGLGGSALNFGLIGPLLSRDLRVVAPDLVGHGRTHADLGAGGAVSANLELLSRFCDEVVGDAPVTLVGHSLGGVLSLLFTMARPEVVDRLILLDPPVSSAADRSRDPGLTARLAFLRAPGVRQLVARQMDKLTPEELVLKQLGDATPHVDRVPAEAVAASTAEIAEHRRGTATRAAHQAQWAAILETIGLLARPRDWQRRLRDLRVETLWLQGVDDRMVPVDDAAALAAIRPDWRFERREGVGHLPHLEDPEWTADQIRSWLG